MAGMADVACCTHVEPAPRIFPAASVDSQKRIALTFDDGPSGSGSTEQILALFDRFGIRATFFVVGRQVEANPAQVRRAFDAGHLISNHSVSHPQFSNLTRDDMVAEVDPVNAALEALGIPVPRYFRPPYGDRDGSDLADVLDERTMRSVLWTIDSRDWEIHDADTVYRNVLRDLRQAWQQGNATNIVLFHDIQPHTPSVVESLIPDLVDDGCAFVQVDAVA
ncbi:MAG: hypothetical protein PVSMB8_00500 [Vulcanimicrobiaceae bacterium]